MGILSGIFGGGKQTTKVDQTKKEKVKSKQTQTQTQTNETNKIGRTQQSGSTTNQQTGSTTALGKTQSVTGSQQVGSNQTQQQLFSGDIIKSLEALVTGGNAGAGIGLDQLGGISQLAQDRLGNFDPQAFIDSQVALGSLNFNDQILPQLRAFDSNVGGVAGTNTMANLLKQQAEGRQGVNQAKIQADATVTANQITGQNIAQAGQAAGQLSQSTIPLLAQLKGALATGQATNQQTGQQTQTGSQENTGTSQQNSAGTSQQTQVQQELVKALAEALSTGTATQESNTNIKGTTTQKDTPSLFGALTQIVSLIPGIQGLNGGGQSKTG